MKVSGQNTVKIMVGTGSSSVEAGRVMAGTGSSSMEAWTSTVEITGTSGTTSRDQLLSALSSRGLDYTEITEIPFELDTSQATDIRDLFSGFTNLKTVPEMDTSNVEDFSGVFMYCSSLETIPELDASSVNESLWTFRGTNSLKSVILRGLTYTMDMPDTKLTPEAADDFMRALGQVSDGARITLPNSARGCNPRIAETKGWNFAHLFDSVQDFDSVGDHVVPIPEWATHADIYMVGGGGGGASGGNLSGLGNGGGGATVRLVTGASLDLPSGHDPINIFMPMAVLRVGDGGAGGTSNNNSPGSPGTNSGLFKSKDANGNYFGWFMAGGAGGSGTGGAPGTGVPAYSFCSETFPAVGTAATDVDGRTPGGGGGGGSTGGLIGGGGRPGRKGGSGRIWVRFRGNG